MDAKTKPPKSLKCPDCKAPLKKRRTPDPDQCEMLCGGCGQIFDICDPRTAETLEKPPHDP